MTVTSDASLDYAHPRTTPQVGVAPLPPIGRPSAASPDGTGPDTGAVGTHVPGECDCPACETHCPRCHKQLEPGPYGGHYSCGDCHAGRED